MRKRSCRLLAGKSCSRASKQVTMRRSDNPAALWNAHARTGLPKNTVWTLSIEHRLLIGLSNSRPRNTFSFSQEDAIRQPVCNSVLKGGMLACLWIREVTSIYPVSTFDSNIWCVSHRRRTKMDAWMHFNVTQAVVPNRQCFTVQGSTAGRGPSVHRKTPSNPHTSRDAVSSTNGPKNQPGGRKCY